MNKKTPRYKDKIFVKDKKHILRTLNTYSKYQDVSKIYVIFNDEYEKYQLLLECKSEAKNDNEDETDSQIDVDKTQKLTSEQDNSENKFYDKKSQLSIKNVRLAKENKIKLNNKMHDDRERKLVYERTNSKISLRDEKIILSVVNSRITKNNLQPETIEALSELIKKYKKASILNDFFEDDKENERIEEIGKILPADLKKEYITGFQSKSFKTNIEKRIYYLIKNQLTYSSLNGLNRLRDTLAIKNQAIRQIRTKIDEVINEEMQVLEQNIKSLMGYSFHYSDEFSASKIEIQKAIKHFDDPYYNKWNLAAWSLEELKKELYLIQKKEALMSPEEKLEIKTIQDFAQSMKECLDTSYKREFESYNSIVAFCKEEELSLDDDAIKKYIRVGNKLYEEERNKTTLGSKRKKAINILNKQYPYFTEVKSTNNYYFRNKILRLHEFILTYKDKYSFNIDYNYFDQAEFVKGDMAQQLLKEGVATWASLEKDAKEERAEIIRKKRLQRILDEQNITEEQYNFNIFYEKLLNHMDKMSQEYEWCCYNKPLTKSCFNEYLEFVSDIKSIQEWNAENVGWEATDDNISGCKDIKEEISDYIDEIYEKIEEDLIAAGIDPNELEDEEENEMDDESSVDIEVEKAHLFEHIPENLRPLFIEVYKFNHSIKKDKVIEDDEEIPF